MSTKKEKSKLKVVLTKFLLIDKIVKKEKDFVLCILRTKKGTKILYITSAETAGLKFLKFRLGYGTTLATTPTTRI